MPDFAIIDPKGGLSEIKPTVSLSDVFIAKGSENVHHRYGRYDRMRGRLPLLIDSEAAKIQAPTDVFAITTIDSGTKTINITGDPTTGGNTDLEIGDTFRVNGSSEADNNVTYTVDTVASGVITTVEPITTQGASGNVFVGTTPVIEYHRHIRKGTGTEHLLLGTKYHILLWLQSDMSMTVKWTNVTPANVFRWEITDHLRDVVATNNSDFVLWWDVDTSVGNDFVALDNVDGIDYEGTAKRLTNCKHIISYEEYLILGFTTEDGTVHPQRERWASLGTGGSIIDFDENSAGDAGAKEFTTTSGTLMGFATHGDDLVIAKQDSMHRSWLVTADQVFEWEEYTLKVGCLSADTLVNDKAGRLYYMGSDLTIREIQTPEPISTNVDITIKDINVGPSDVSANVPASELMQATFIDEFDSIWFAFALGSNNTNDTVVQYHPNSGRADIHKFPIRAFGDFTQQEAFTYDTLPYDTYDEWGADWLIYDTSRNVVGFPLDLASDYEGSTFALHRATNDDGELFTGTLIVSTSMTNPMSLNLFKRVNNGVDLLFVRQTAGDAILSVKRDTEKDWQELGTASFIDADGPESIIVHLPFDKRAKSFQWRLQTTADMQFIGFIFREFEIDDNR